MLDTITVFWAKYGSDLLKGTWDTLVITGISTIFAYLIGLPLGVILTITQPNGIRPNRAVNQILGWIVNVGRSLPFIILMVAIMPFTKLIVGTKIGVKGAIVDAARTLPSSVSFLGGHPMAGTEFSGIQHALPNMFQGAHYILTPDEGTQPEHLALMERVARHLGCADVVRTTPEQHDAIIAYTSQMMHIIAVSVCDDPSLVAYQGFEGDSFRGCTRVAALDVPLWTQLFSLNAPALTQALETLEDNLRLYRQVIQSGDTRQLADKLAFSAARKRKMNQLEAERGAPGRGA